MLTAGATTLNTATLTTGGSQTYNGPVLLAHDAVLASSGANTTFASTINGAFSLTVATAGIAIFQGDIGGTTPLTTLITKTSSTQWAGRSTLRVTRPTTARST